MYPTYHIVEVPNKGRGVCALASFAAGNHIMFFGGECMPWSSMKDLIESIGDHYVQVGSDIFMGPDGQADDYVNHSCDPNCWLKCDGKGKAELLALRTIKQGEEITWDYSTTMNEEGYSVECHCGSPACRGIIGPYQTLPDEIKSRYLQLGIIPAYLANTVSAN